MTSDSNVYHVRLKDSLLQGLQFSRIGDYELTYVDAVVRVVGDVSQDRALEPLGGDAAVGHDAVFVGDAKLAELGQLLTSHGFRTQLHGGVLVCDNDVLVKKVVDSDTGETTLAVEGVLGQAYFRVRDLIYSQFVVL